MIKMLSFKMKDDKLQDILQELDVDCYGKGCNYLEEDKQINASATIAQQPLQAEGLANNIIINVQKPSDWEAIYLQAKSDEMEEPLIIEEIGGIENGIF